MTQQKNYLAGTEAIHYIDQKNALLDFCAAIEASPWLALDTEFMRESTYYPQLCLLQIADDRQIACVDVLKIECLTPLFNLIYHPNTLKIFHAAGQDMEIFYHLQQRLPVPVFDTQVAAGLLGYGDQISYAGLVEQLLKIKLNKSQTRTNWAQRPLNQHQLQYAADDVRYLRELHPLLHDAMAQQQRSDWPDYEHARLCNTATYQIDLDTVWQRVAHAKKLQNFQLPVIQALAHWRERQAMQENKPRRWILADSILIELSLHMPTSLAALSAIRNEQQAIPSQYHNALLHTIDAARRLPAEQWPQAPQSAPPSPAEKALLHALSTHIKAVSLKLNINTSALASRKDLQKLIDGRRDIPLLQSWRYEAAGSTALDILAKHDRVR